MIRSQLAGMLLALCVCVCMCMGVNEYAVIMRKECLIYICKLIESALRASIWVYACWLFGASLAITEKLENRENSTYLSWKNWHFRLVGDSSSPSTGYDSRVGRDIFIHYKLCYFILLFIIIYYYSLFYVPSYFIY